jgi:hypothetical protein
MPHTLSVDNLVPPGAYERVLRLLLLLNLMDALFTIAWIGWGWASEANPVMAMAIEQSPSGFILAKVALVSLAVGLLWRLREHRMAHAAVIPLGLLYAFVAGQHLGFAVLVGA